MTLVKVTLDYSGIANVDEAQGSDGRLTAIGRINRQAREEHF